MTNVAVTGSSGFVGAHLVEKLKSLNINVIEIDEKTGIDITDWHQLEPLKNFNIIFHLAAKTYVPQSFEHPRDFFHTNIVGTLNILELCRINKSKMVFVSSYVYGQPQYLPIDERHPVSASNPYSQSKIIAEQLCTAYNRDFNLPVIILRPFNLYGRGQNENFLIPTIIKQVKTGKIILKDSRPNRDFLHIDDFTDLLVKAGQYDKSSFEIFNAGSGKSFSVKQVGDIICDLAGSDSVIEYQDQQRPSRSTSRS